MRSIASRLALILTGAILLVAMVVLMIGRPESCGLPDSPKPHVAATASAGAPSPTPAPPQNLVFVRVESDKPDIQVGWAEN